MTESRTGAEQSIFPTFDAYQRDLERANLELQQEIAERRRIEAALRDHARRLAHLHTTQIAILSAQSLSDTLDITIRHIKDTLPCLSTTMVVYDFDRNELEVLRSDRPEFATGRRLPILMPEAIAQLRHGKHYFLRDIRDPADAHPGMQTAVEIGGRSVLLLPLRYRDELIGAMTVTTGVVHEFSAEELAIAREIAGSLAIAIQHHRWLEAEQEAREREATLRQVAQSLTTDLDVDTVLRGILERLDRIVPTISSAIFLREGDQVRTGAIRAPSVNEMAIQQLLAERPPLIFQLLNSGQPRVIADTHTDPEWRILPGGAYIRSWMGIPLTVKGRTIGLLTLDRDNPDAFDEQDLTRATILAAQAAIGIENARLFRHEQESAVRLEREVRERTKELQALYDISAAANENLEQDLLLDFSLSRAVNAMGSDAGAVHLVDSETDQLRLAAAIGLNEAQLSAVAFQGANGRRLWQQFVERDWSATDIAMDMTAMHGCEAFKGCVLVPLRSRGQTLGTLLLMSRENHDLSPDLRNLLAAIADQIALAIASTRLRQTARQTAVLAERERIARDLHDVVTQSIYSLINFAEAARETAIAGDMDEVQRNAQSIMQTAQQVLGEMRMLLYDLRSDVLASKGLAEALAERLATVEQRVGLATDLQVDGAERLPAALEDVLYRVALEALNNTLRHAKARTVIVRVVVRDDTAVLMVSDDGRGFLTDTIREGPGMGVSNMRRRAHNVGGSLHIESAPTAGTVVEFRVPLSQRARDRRSAGPAPLEEPVA